MKKVKIISGTYGYNDGKHIIPKDRRSGAFALEDKEADRLIALSVAECVEDSEPSQNFKGTKEKPEGTPIKSPADADDLSYNANSSVQDLRRIGKAVGLIFGVGVTKANMIAALDEFFGKEPEGDEPAPDISVEDPVE